MLAKEQAKALAMRQRFEERTRRFLDTKQRTIGVDKEYLQKQVEEKRLRVEKDKEDGKNEGELHEIYESFLSSYLQYETNILLNLPAYINSYSVRTAL